jgi:hypothetical protein
MKIFAFLSILLFGAVPALANTHFKCVDPEASHILIIVDFENGDVGAAQGGKVISAERMTQIEPQFSQVGESMSVSRTARTESGSVTIRKHQDGSNISGSYQSALTFGDRWNLVCVQSPN